MTKPMRNAQAWIVKSVASCYDAVLTIEQANAAIVGDDAAFYAALDVLPREGYGTSVVWALRNAHQNKTPINVERVCQLYAHCVQQYTERVLFKKVGMMEKIRIGRQAWQDAANECFYRITGERGTPDVKPIDFSGAPWGRDF
jgi:hypothetical protein